MSDQPVDSGKRTWIIASGCAGAVGAGLRRRSLRRAVSSLPSAPAPPAPPVEVDIGGLKPGEKLTVEWRGKPVWIVRRTPEQLAALAKLDAELADPNRERKPDELTPHTRATSTARSSPRSSSSSASAPTSAARRATSSSPARSLRCPTTGPAVSSAPATARPSTWPAASSRTSPRPTTSRCRRTCTCPTPGCSSAKTRRPDPVARDAGRAIAATTGTSSSTPSTCCRWTAGSAPRADRGPQVLPKPACR